MIYHRRRLRRWRSGWEPVGGADANAWCALEEYIGELVGAPVAGLDGERAMSEEYLAAVDRVWVTRDARAARGGLNLDGQHVILQKVLTAEPFDACPCPPAAHRRHPRNGGVGLVARCAARASAEGAQPRQVRLVNVARLAASRAVNLQPRRKLRRGPSLGVGL